MPQMIPLQTIVLHRDGKPVVPTIGKPFPFTDDEVAELGSALRAPVNETPAPAAAPASAPAAKVGKGGKGEESL
ncbi:MAG: hypothetical protein RL268_1672 [Pseudomonadota bacterium]|jgi:hypothetical protein